MNKILLGIHDAALGCMDNDGAGTFSRCFSFNDSFVGFKGHFPGQPILPAIVEILTVVFLAGEQSGNSQRLVSIEDAKFLSPIRPNQVVLVKCCQKSLRGKTLHEAQLSVAGKTAASFLLELSSEGDVL